MKFAFDLLSGKNTWHKSCFDFDGILCSSVVYRNLNQIHENLLQLQFVRLDDIMIEVFKENFNGDLLLLVYGLEHVYYFEDGVSDVEILDHV